MHTLHTFVRPFPHYLRALLIYCVCTRAVWPVLTRTQGVWFACLNCLRRVGKEVEELEGKGMRNRKLRRRELRESERGRFEGKRERLFRERDRFKREWEKDDGFCTERSRDLRNCVVRVFPPADHQLLNIIATSNLQWVVTCFVSQKKGVAEKALGLLRAVVAGTALLLFVLYSSILLFLYCGFFILLLLLFHSFL